MSELIQNNTRETTIRWKLFASASALALTAHIASSGNARAEDADRATVWIELGGQLNGMQDGQETFSPAIMSMRPPDFKPSDQLEHLPRHSIDEFGSITVEPRNSHWQFSASVRYGRSTSNKHVLQQTSPQVFEKYIYGIPNGYPIAQRFAETTAHTSEQHAILDFMAGKDVGLGLFGSREGTSVISAGVRFAQFISTSNISLKSDPDWKFKFKYQTYIHATITNGQLFHSNIASMMGEQSFHGLGPSLSWKASAPLVENSEDSSIDVNWGVNASILFGRQKSRTHHQSTARYFNISRPILTKTAVPHTISRFPATPDHSRSHSVTVPNIGAFAGLSFKYANALVNFGYRADFFFGAMDGGIDTRKSYDRDFYGPYATISIGFGN